MIDFPEFTFERWNDELKRFKQYYAIEFIAGCPDRKMRGLKPKSERVCRFCKRNNTHTKFKKAAHVIPELLGNRYLVSDYECDACNDFFSRYEDNLADFLGISRTILGVNAKESVPSFTSSGKTIIAEYGEFHGIRDCIKIERSDVSNKAFDIDDKQGKTEINFLKNSYTPVKVYKAFLKIALSILPDSHISSYQEAINILLDDSCDYTLSELFKVVHYQLPIGYHQEKPSCLIIKRLGKEKSCVTHVFYLRFQNNVFEFPLLLHSEDIARGLYETGNTFSVPMCPPILFSKPQVEIDCGVSIKNLSSNIKLKEKESIVFSYPPNSIEHLPVTRVETGEIVKEPFNPDDAIAMYISPVTPKE